MEWTKTGSMRLMNMRSMISWAKRGGWLLGVALGLAATNISAQTAGLVTLDSSYDRLSSIQPPQTASPDIVTTRMDHTASDPYTVLTTGALWQDTYSTSYIHRTSDKLSLSCETSSVTMNDGAVDLSHGQKVGLSFQPLESLTLSSNVHQSAYDGPILADSFTTRGAGFSAESHLPGQSVLTFGLNSDRSDFLAGNPSESNACDAQLQQPLGKVPFTAVLKGHYDETTSAGAPTARKPSLEQALVWKPIQDTTIKMGMRQEHYEDFPGITSEYNQALFADWSQNILSNQIAWHSYAEMLNSRGVPDVAPAVPLTNGANGTPQATTPGPSLSSAIPLTLDDKTLTFSTGPSFRLQQDLSAAIEYSNRWSQNPLPGAVAQEQRVSVSLKGTF